MAAEDTLQKRINDYLYFGYLPPSEFPDFLSKIENDQPAEYSLKNTTLLLEKVFADALEDASNSGYCIIPISGGWDSRLLLGLALENFPVRNIKTYTFGSPNQLDFEIGKLVARKSGVEHHAFDLSEIILEKKALKQSVREAPWTYVPDAYFNKYCYREMAGENDIILSGFMGDPLTGGHSYKDNNANIKKYFSREQSVLKSHNIIQTDYEPSDSLPDLPASSPFLWHELLDLGVRQARCIVPIISSKKIWDSWGTSLGTIEGTNSEIITPFAHQKWIQYWIDAPDSAKTNQKLYLDLLYYKFPKLAQLPSKKYYGARKASGLGFHFRKKLYHGKKLLNLKFPSFFNEPSHMMNYLSYAWAFRNRDDYRDILTYAMNILKRHRLTPWIDLEKYFKEHSQGVADHSKIFLLLIGLAFNVTVNGLKKVHKDE